ncbi:MAG: nucleotidyl transferase AbiEii/AbiGii toxin family protein [Microgenomates group bacterium]
MKSPLYFQFEKILKQAKELGYPITKKESILREFLQVKILEKIYQQKNSRFLFFVGGTSLRILQDLDRFSEDLDFDYINLETKDIEEIYKNVVFSLRQENIEVKTYKNLDKKPIEFELRFPKILYELGLSSYLSQNLVIKLDFDNFWKNLKAEIIQLEKFDVSEKIITIPKNQLLVQKLFAYLNRKQTLARDIYDIVWLISNDAKIDWDFLRVNKIDKNIKTKVLEKFLKDEKKLNILKKQLEPLLLNTNSAKKIDNFKNYMLSAKNLIFEKFTIDEIGDVINYIFAFRLDTKEYKKILKFIIRVTGTAAVKITHDLPTSELDNLKIEETVRKLLDFYDKNIIKDYQTKLVSTLNVDHFRLSNLDCFLE